MEIYEIGITYYMTIYLKTQKSINSVHKVFSEIVTNRKVIGTVRIGIT